MVACLSEGFPVRSMKFGKTLTQEAVPEWLPMYVNYKQLKKEIKKLLRAQEGMCAFLSKKKGAC
jgi:SPX domain protein involved in polyphosphate accumulation